MLIDDANECVAFLDKHFRKAGLSNRLAALDDLKANLDRSAVYALDVETALFLDSMAHDIRKGAVAFSDLEHLPHETMFIEWPFAAVSAARAARGGAAVDVSRQAVPAKVGVLLRRASGTLYASIIMSGEPPFPAMLPAFEFNVSELGRNLGLAGKREEVVSGGYPSVMWPGDPSGDLGPQLLQDLADELPLTLGFLLFLTSPDHDTVDFESVDNSKLNRNRIAKGRPAARGYRRVKLGEFGRVHMEAVKEERERNGPCAHIVRGHYFRSHGKLVWRRPHVRGVNHDGSEPDQVRATVSMGM